MALLLFCFLWECLRSREQRVQNASEESCTRKDQQGGQPVLDGEGVAEVEDGEEETDKLAKCDDQRHHERGALGRQDEDSTDADVPEAQVKDLSTTVHSQEHAP